MGLSPAAETNGPARLVIVKAVYGNLTNAESTADVTAIVAALADDKGVDVVVNNENFGDPARFESKALKVEYLLDGKAESVPIPEGGKLLISLSAPPVTTRNGGTSNLIIRKAVYGALPNGSVKDVTAMLSASVTNDALNIDVSNNRFGDPAPGHPKKLQVEFTLNGQEKSKTVFQGARLIISRHEARSYQLVIHKAAYGKLSNPDATIDVTSVIAAMVYEDTLDLEVNGNFGDPAPNEKKQLRVDYAFAGAERSKTVFEGDRMQISRRDNPKAPGPPPGPSKLVIRKATYGILPDGSANDVTAIVAALVKDDGVDLTVNEKNFGDPAPRQGGKKIEVEFSFDGREGAKTAFEYSKLSISARDAEPAAISRRPRLVVQRALYSGVSGNGVTNDVTGIVAAQVKNDQLDLKVNTETFGNPADRQRKLLRLDYTFDGRLKSKTVEENQVLKIDAASEASYRWLEVCGLFLLAGGAMTGLLFLGRRAAARWSGDRLRATAERMISQPVTVGGHKLPAARWWKIKRGKMIKKRGCGGRQKCVSI